MDNIEVEIDDREQDRIKPALKFFNKNKISDKAVTGVLKHKTSADYSFKNVGVEFKTIPDFISSTMNGRLKREILAMKEEYGKEYVIIQGEMDKSIKAYNSQAVKNNYHRKFNKQEYFGKEKFFGHIASLSQITTIFHVENFDQALILMLKLFEKTFDGKIRDAPDPELHTRNTILNFLCSINGINKNKAFKIINTLGIKNLKDLIGLNPDDFKKVNGIGEKTSKKIVEWIK